MLYISPIKYVFPSHWEGGTEGKWVAMAREGSCVILEL